jgi:hypothetical protein
MEELTRMIQRILRLHSRIRAIQHHQHYTQIPRCKENSNVLLAIPRQDPDAVACPDAEG